MTGQVHIGVLRVALVVRSARSLKDLRRPVVSLRDRLGSRFNLAVHQIESGQRPARAVLVGVTVGNDARALRSLLDQAAAFARSSGGPLVADVVVDVFPWAFRARIPGEWQPSDGWNDDE